MSIAKLCSVALFVLLFGACGDSDQSSMRTKAGEPLVVDSPAGTVRIPTDALPDDVGIRLSSESVASLSNDPTTSAELPVGEVLIIDFSLATGAAESIQIELPLPDGFTGSAYALMRAEGTGINPRVSDTGWRLLPGLVDTDRSLLIVTIIGTTERISLLPVTTDTAATSPAASIRAIGNRLLTLSGISTASAADIPTASPRNVPILRETWAGVCRKGSFEQCVDNGPALINVANLAQRSGKALRGVGFDTIYFAPSVGELLGVIGIQVGRAGARGSGSNLYIVEVAESLDEVTFDEDGNRQVENFFGWYNYVSGTMTVEYDVASDTLIHELMHAVQRAEMPSTFDRRHWRTNGNWIHEGMASAVEVFSPDGTSTKQSGRAYRYLGEWRRWGWNLASDRNLFAYQSLELWLNIDPSLRYLAGFMQSLDASTKATGVNSRNEFSVADQALQSSAGVGLKEAYEDLLVQRDSQNEYPHCRNLIVQCSDRSCTLLDADGNDRDVPTYGMAAYCRDIDVRFDDGDCVNPYFDLEFDGLDGERLLLDGEWIDTGQTVSAPNPMRIWAVNSDIKSTANKKLEFWGFDTEIRPRCGFVSRVAYSQVAAASAVSTRYSDGHGGSEGYMARFDWDPFTGVEQRVVRDKNGADIDAGVPSGNSVAAVKQSHSVSAPGGASASVDIQTRTKDDGDSFSVHGEFELKSSPPGGAYTGVASADVSWSLAVAVKRPALIEIVNCPIFDQEVLASHGSLISAGQTCRLQVDGASTSEIPGFPGMMPSSEDYDEVFEIYDMDDDDLPADSLEALQDLYADPEFNDLILEQARGLGDALTGNIMMFVINSLAESGIEGSGLAPNAEESFSVTITALPDKRN